MEYIKLNNIRLPGFNHKISVTSEIDSENPTKNTSGTDRIFKGYKPKVYGCELTLNKKSRKIGNKPSSVTYTEEINKMYGFFHALTNKVPTRYRLDHSVADASKNRLVSFNGTFAQQDNYPDYTVTFRFQLIEGKSMPADREAKKNSAGKQSVETSTASGSQASIDQIMEKAGITKDDLPEGTDTLDKILEWLNKKAQNFFETEEEKKKRKLQEQVDSQTK